MKPTPSAKSEPQKCARCHGVVLPKGVSLSGDNFYCLCPAEVDTATICPHCGGKVYVRINLTVEQAGQQPDT
jgi:recombinational DNA repair protein (RecF pathway)